MYVFDPFSFPWLRSDRFHQRGWESVQANLPPQETKPPQVVTDPHGVPAHDNYIFLQGVQRHFRVQASMQGAVGVQVRLPLIQPLRSASTLGGRRRPPGEIIKDR